MNKVMVLGLLIPLIIVLGITFNLQDVSALRVNEEYLILSENYFMAFSTSENKTVIPIDGGVLYNEKWYTVNIETITVEQYEEGNVGWIIGNLTSGEQFWFTWNLTLNSNIVTGVWIYDGTTLTEITDYDAYMTRLFY